MKAIVVRAFGGPEVLRYEDAPDPRPGKGEILMRNRAICVNPKDTQIRSGSKDSVSSSGIASQFPNARSWFPTLPWTPGLNDVAGVVEAVGEGVTSLKVGDRVHSFWTTTGTYAELTVCPENAAVKLPANVTFGQGATLGDNYPTAWVALFRKAHLQPGEVVLVHGASGGVGIAVTQFARAAGAIVIGTAGTSEGEKVALEAGAHHVLDHNAKDHLAKAVAITKGRGIDVIVEMVANHNLNTDLEALTTGGRIIVVGSTPGKLVEVDPILCMRRDASIIGFSLRNLTLEEKARLQLAIIPGLENGSLKPIIGREIPLRDAAEAHRILFSAGARGKIVLIP